MSRTPERTEGSVTHTQSGLMKPLFLGEIHENVLFPFPQLEEPEVDIVNQLMLAVRRFASKQVDSRKIDRERCIPEEVMLGLKQQGLFGMLVPKEYGGLGLSVAAYARVIQELSGIDSSLGITIVAHQSGAMGLLIFGTGDQKRKYLPRVASGELVTAFALTEAGAGSDAAAIQTRADPFEGGFLLAGEKNWVTNGATAGLFTVFARTSPAEHGAKPRLTAFLVERAFGVKSGPNQPTLGVRGTSTTSIVLEGVKVPLANVLGEMGRGFMVAMKTLNAGRLGLAAGCVGLCKSLLGMATERTQERRAFGRPIAQFALVKDKVATMLAETFALESMVYMTTGMAESSSADYAIESAICKVFGSETVHHVANEALQIAAGAGYMQDHPFERLLRDARVNLVFQGTNEILRCFVALSGMASPGREAVEVWPSIREPIKGFGLLTDFAIRKARTAFARERLTRAHPLLNREAVVFEEYAAELAKAAEKVLRKHGKNIAEMQYTQRRLADMAIDLYAIASVISRTTRILEHRHEEGARREVDLTTMFVAAAEQRLAANVASFEKNDDELRKAIADRAYVDRGYPFDVV